MHMATAASQTRLPSFSHKKSFKYTLYARTRLRHSQSGAKADTGCPGIAVATTAAAPAPTDEHFMRLALEQAQTASEQGEVPIGAVLVINSEVVAAAYNLTETKQNPLCHAELLCISAAAQEQLAWRLHEATLYSTIEPCPMCAGAVLQARLARLVYGARQPRVGADGSWVAMFPQQQQQLLQQQPPEQEQVIQQAYHEQQVRHEASAEQVHYTQQSTVSDERQGQGPESIHQHVHHQQQQQQVPKWDRQQQQQVPEQQEGWDTGEQQCVQQPQRQPLLPVGPHPFHPDIQVTRGVLASECAALMKAFFRKRREHQKAAAAAAAAAAVALVEVPSQEQCTHQHSGLHQQQPATAAQAGAPSAAMTSGALDGSCVASGAAAGVSPGGVRADADAALWLSSSTCDSSGDDS